MNLSLREKIGQTVIVEFRPNGSRDYEEKMAQFIIENNIGGVFVGNEIIKDNHADGNETRFFLERLQKEAKIPLIVCADTEYGCGIALGEKTMLPHPMALGATDDAALAYEFGKATALESIDMGMNLSLSPVVDVLYNRNNYLTGVRSVGDNPDKTIPLLKEVVRGMQENGYGACIKHFPGDGVDWRNQHFVTTVNALPMEEWNRQHGRVFRELIHAGAASVMVGHISLPAWQGEEQLKGMTPPGTLSKRIVTDLLKEELGFDGAVMSDALNMGGYLGWFPTAEEHNLHSMKIGIDMLLWPSPGYIDAMEKAVLSGEISPERLDDAVRRIMRTKEKLGLFEKRVLPDAKAASQYARQTAQKIAEKSLVLRADQPDFRPLTKKKGKVLLLPISEWPTFSEELKPMIAGLRERGFQVDMLTDYWLPEIQDTDYDYHIYVVGHGFYLGLSQNSFPPIWSSLCYGAEKSVVVSLQSPYYYEDYFRFAPVYVDAFSSSPASQEAVLRLLFGEIEAEGKLPVVIKA